MDTTAWNHTEMVGIGVRTCRERCSKYWLRKSKTITIIFSIDSQDENVVVGWLKKLTRWSFGIWSVLDEGPPEGWSQKYECGGWLRHFFGSKLKALTI